MGQTVGNGFPVFCGVSNNKRDSSMKKNTKREYYASQLQYKLRESLWNETKLIDNYVHLNASKKDRLIYGYLRNILKSNNIDYLDNLSNEFKIIDIILNIYFDLDQIDFEHIKLNLIGNIIRKPYCNMYKDASRKIFEIGLMVNTKFKVINRQPLFDNKSRRVQIFIETLNSKRKGYVYIEDTNIFKETIYHKKRNILINKIINKFNFMDKKLNINRWVFKHKNLGDCVSLYDTYLGLISIGNVYRNDEIYLVYPIKKRDILPNQYFYIYCCNENEGKYGWINIGNPLT